LEKYLKHSLDTISPAEIGDLRAVHAAIKEGDATWADYLKTDEPAEPTKPVTFQDDPAGDKPPRKPRSDKGTKRAAEEAPPQPRNDEIPNTMHPDSDEPGKSERDALCDEIQAIYDKSPGHVMQAQKNLVLAIGRGNMPGSLDGCIRLLDEVKRLQAERPPVNGR
jgi:hypothetical protein